MNYRLRVATAKAWLLGATHYIKLDRIRDPRVTFLKDDGHGEAVIVARLWLTDDGEVPTFAELSTLDAGLRLGCWLKSGLIKPILQPVAYRVCYQDITHIGEDEEPEVESDVLIDLEVCEDFGEVRQLVGRWGCDSWSSWPHIPGQNDWLCADQGTVDYRTGRSRETTIHALSPRALRYLEKAAKSQGVR